MRPLVVAVAFLVSNIARAEPHTESTIAAETLTAAIQGTKVGELTLKDGKTYVLACAANGSELSCAAFGSNGRTDMVSVTNVGLGELRFQAGAIEHTVTIAGKHKLTLGGPTYVESVWKPKAP